MQDDRVAHAHIQSCDLILVVQGRTRDGGAVHHNRTHDRNRRNNAGSAHLQDDVLHHRRRLLCGEFVGDGEARRFAGKAEPLLQLALVYLHHYAVNTVRFAPRASDPSFIERKNLVNVFAAPVVLVHLKAERREKCELFLLSCGLGLEFCNVVHKAV